MRSNLSFVSGPYLWLGPLIAIVLGPGFGLGFGPDDLHDLDDGKYYDLVECLADFADQISDSNDHFGLSENRLGLRDRGPDLVLTSSSRELVLSVL